MKDLARRLYFAGAVLYVAVELGDRLITELEWRIAAAVARQLQWRLDEALLSVRADTAKTAAAIVEPPPRRRGRKS